MSPTKPTKEPTVDDLASLTFEQAMEQLQQLVDRMESGASGLKDSLDDYRRGAALVKHCRALLKEADEEIGRLAAGDR
ncbi:MAG: exodeoxyribonuclease VII small subunit [Phycisphaerae bacterium]|nr:exodeoxyribonuclease VII small subunit [Phycisphaerae bacterium]